MYYCTFFQELQMSVLLIVVAVSHALLTTPGNIGFLMFTNFPSVRYNLYFPLKPQ